MFTSIHVENPIHEWIRTEISALDVDGLGVYVRTVTKHINGVTEFATFIPGARVEDNKIVKGD